MKRLDSHECASAIERAHEHPDCVTLLHAVKDATCDTSHGFTDLDGQYYYFEDHNPERYRCFEARIVKTREEAIGTIYSHWISVDVDHNFERSEGESQYGFSDDSDNAVEMVCAALVIHGNSDMRAAIALLGEGEQRRDFPQIRKQDRALITPKILRLLANAPEPEVRLCASTSPMAPYALFKMLAYDNNANNRASYAASKKATRDLLDKLSRDRDKNVKTNVAQNLRTPTKVLRELGEYVCETIAEWGVDYDSLSRAGYKQPFFVIYDADRLGVCLAGNPHTPTDTLHQLSRLKSKHIKLAVSGNPNALPETLSELLDSAARFKYRDGKEYLSLCVALAENPSTPVELLRKLSEDRWWMLSNIADFPFPWEAEAVVERINQRAAGAVDNRIDSPHAASDVGLPSASQLEIMSFSRDAETRRMARDCENTPDHVRQRLSYDPELVDWSHIDRTGILDWSDVSMWDEPDDWSIWSETDGYHDVRDYYFGRQHLYSSNDAAEERELLDARMKEVLERCLPVFEAPTSLLEILSLSTNPVDRMEAALDENTSYEILERLSLDHYPFVRSAVASNKYANECTLNRLARDVDASVRASLAGNANLPAEALDVLLNDTDPNVRYKIRRHADGSKDWYPSRMTSDYPVNTDTIEVMEELARIGYEPYLALLAKSENTPQHTLEWIYSLRDRQLMMMLAHNPGMPDVSQPYVSPSNAPTFEIHTAPSEQEVEPVESEDEDDGINSDYVDDDYVPTIQDVIDSLGYDPTEWHYDEDNGWLDYYPEE